MSTLLVEVDSEQEAILGNLLNYMNVSFQKLSPADDFGDELSATAIGKIEAGLADAKAGRYTTLPVVMDYLKSL